VDQNVDIIKTNKGKTMNAHKKKYLEKIFFFSPKNILGKKQIVLYRHRIYTHVFVAINAEFRRTKCWDINYSQQLLVYRG
jgi:hypothetical protein